MEKLRDAGAEVSYSDPHVPVFPETREHYFDLSSVELTRANIGEFDCLLLATDHDRFDYDLIAKASLVIDSRGPLHAAANVVKDCRSEERRVGEECGSKCRSRWMPCHSKKNKKQK